MAAEYIRCDPASTSVGAAGSYFEIEDHGSNKLALKIPAAGGGASLYCGLTGAAYAASSTGAASVSTSCVDDDACLQARSDLYVSLALYLSISMSRLLYLSICGSHLMCRNLWVSLALYLSVCVNSAGLGGIAGSIAQLALAIALLIRTDKTCWIAALPPATIAPRLLPQSHRQLLLQQPRRQAWTVSAARIVVAYSLNLVLALSTVLWLNRLLLLPPSLPLSSSFSCSS